MVRPTSSLWPSNSSSGITKFVWEGKFMTQARGIRIHQYLDNLLLRAPCQETCLQHTQILLALCQGLGCVVGTDSPTNVQLCRILL